MKHRHLHRVALPFASWLLLCHCGDGADSAPIIPGGEGDTTPETTPATPETPSAMPPDGETPGGDPSSGDPSNGEGGPTPVGNVTPTEPTPGSGETPGTPDTPADGMTPVTPPFEGSFILGADISGIPELVDFGVQFVDTDGVAKSMLELLKAHGFNYVRLRTFVNPLAPFGYGSGDGCTA